MSEVLEREKSTEVERGEMDTPEKIKSGQIAVSVNKFEESPVYNFLNSLSPINPIKSAPVSQTINSLNFASLPSVFTSPHVGSLRESRFLLRNRLPDPSKPEFSSIDGNKDGANELKTDAGDENFNQTVCNSEVCGEPCYDGTKFMVESAQNLSYDCNNPSSAMILVPLVRDPSQGNSYGHEAINDSAYQIDQNKEATSCDWDSLIDPSDLLIFESPNVTDSCRKSVDRATTSFYASIENDMHQMQSQCSSAPCEQIIERSQSENLGTQPGEGNDLPEYTETHENAADPCTNNAEENIDYEHLSGYYRGIRRRCLVFEMAGARMKQHLNEKNLNSSVLSQSEGSTSTNEEQQLVLTKMENDTSRRVLPGIGLHLNAIASTPKDYKFINQDSSSSSRRLLIGPSSSSVNFQTSSPGQELMVDNTVPDHSSERNSVNEEVNPRSPKKKRRREQAAEPESCKRCNCKKSKCLKLYCECFAAGVYCVEPCACIDCFNKPIHEDTVLATRKQIESRNPLAFAPKVIRGSNPISETGDDSTKTPASARHKRGCNCKKSGCLKKYCECYQGGVGCSINCRCEGCTNAFGRKDGSSVRAMELEVEEDETDKNEKTILNITNQKVPILNVTDQNNDSAPLTAPLLPCRQSFSSKEKPLRSSFTSIGSSSSSNLYMTKHGDKNQSSHFDTIIEEDEIIPDFLQEHSPLCGIKSSSPNRKRVSLPQSSVSTGLRSSRKLILQSIPSFPSLTSNQ